MQHCRGKKTQSYDGSKMYITLGLASLQQAWEWNGAGVSNKHFLQVVRLFNSIQSSAQLFFHSFSLSEVAESLT